MSSMSAKLVFGTLALMGTWGVWGAATEEPGPLPEWLFGLMTLGFAAFMASERRDALAHASPDRLPQVRIALHGGLSAWQSVGGPVEMKR